MGFLKKLFGGDPRRELERADELLKSGDVEKALQVALRAQKQATPDVENKARLVVQRVKEAFVSMALEKVSWAEESEYFTDAVEWIDVALEHIEDETRRSELNERKRSLSRRAEEAESEDWEPEPEADTQTELDPQIHYQALIDMLTEEAASRYETRSPAFRVAYVALNEGRTEEAYEAFNLLTDRDENDPVLRLERGRCRLKLGEPEGAVDDFEAAWAAFGEQPLDLSGELSVPGLWAEAMLGQGEAKAVADRLKDLADPIDAAPLAELYAQALLMTQRFEDARDFLASAIAHNSGRDHFSFQMAQALDQLGERGAAIDCLEMAIKPSCTTGCKPRARYLPSFRALATLHLEDGGQPERVRELMTFVAQAMGGRLTSQDHSLLARYYDQIGDQEAAEHARGHARRLLEEPVEERHAAGPVASAGSMRAPI